MFFYFTYSIYYNYYLFLMYKFAYFVCCIVLYFLTVCFFEFCITFLLFNHNFVNNFYFFFFLIAGFLGFPASFLLDVVYFLRTSLVFTVCVVYEWASVVFFTEFCLWMSRGMVLHVSPSYVCRRRCWQRENHHTKSMYGSVYVCTNVRLYQYVGTQSKA